ncbi:MAG: class I SAM-dependent methyltransferase [Thermoleophilaceae bacterium]
MSARPCPVCGSEDDSRIVAESNVDAERLGPYAFASRKVPELMRHRLVECPTCDAVYASPAPAATALADAYEEAAYDSGEEARYAAVTYARLVRRLLPRLPAAGAALDVGAGDGAFLAQLLALGFDEATGVEPSAAPVAAATPELRRRIRQDVFRVGDFEPASFRLVTAFQTLEHVADPLELCRGAGTLLRPGGALLVVCHDRRAVVNRAMGLRSPIHDLEHLQLFSPRSLGRLLERAGLGPIALRRVANRYPLRYWLRLAPVPGRMRLIAAADRMGVGVLPVSLRVGNLVAVGFAPRG